MLRLTSAPDGGEWTGTKMERATGGEVGENYFRALRNGDVGVPRADKIAAIASAMGFSPGLWFKDLSWWEAAEENWEKGGGGPVPEEGRGGGPRDPGGEAGERVARLLNLLFEAKVDARGEPYTEEKVAGASGGALSEKDVRAMREGTLAEPTRAQLLALCDVFEVEPSYWFGGEDRPAWRPPPAVLEAAAGRDAYVLFQNSLRLDAADRSILKTLAEQLRRRHQSERNAGGGSGNL